MGADLPGGLAGAPPRVPGSDAGGGSVGDLPGGAAGGAVGGPADAPPCAPGPDVAGGSAGGAGGGPVGGAAGGPVGDPGGGSAGRLGGERAGDPGPSPSSRSRLRYDETLLVVTDGVTEARDRRGEFYALVRELERAVASEPGRAAPDQLVRTVRDGVLRHTRGRLGDDTTVFAVRRLREASR
ncbi:SpoIIE family protein phosphatase [Streptomyces sp. NPDC005435]|uniref:SpoIIE family protein phosphatase n=1 Tax=Streptomyces sp. NPDC005435 TaxID=3154464 RepID=UPI00387E4AFD